MPKAQAQSRDRVSQSELPSHKFSEALKIARALIDNFAGAPTAPHDIAMSLNVSPTSSNWRYLSGAAVAYGLTTAGYNADRIGLTDLGRRIVAPTEDGDDKIAVVEAILKPSILGNFFQRYDKNKFPRDEIAKNVLAELGVPRDRLQASFEILVANGKDHGIIRETKTGPFVAVQIARNRDAVPFAHNDDEPAKADDNVLPIPVDPARAMNNAMNNRVFISHGKNKKIVDQLKTVIGYGNFQPVVSVENETVSKPIPQKVLDDMRSCSFAVIHIDDEQELLDKEGNKHIHLNQNVLIEIGAALALHKDRFVLLVKDGVQVPSNLQGLYQCRYSGETLDFDATMRLLKAFNDFRGNKAA
jgi:predicted nucleotide-binding protein